MKTLSLISVICFVLLFISTPVIAAEVTNKMLMWQVSDEPCAVEGTDCSAAGFNIYYWDSGTTPPTSLQDAEARPDEIFKYVHDSSTPGISLAGDVLPLKLSHRYYFTITAWNAAGESAFNPEPLMEYQVPLYNPGESNLPSGEDYTRIIVPEGKAVVMSIVDAP